MVAPRARAASSDSSTSAPEPSASTKPSRSLENGFDAFSGISLCVESADSSEKRISASAVAEPSAPIASARSHSLRRIASTPSWIAVAPEAQKQGVGRRLLDECLTAWPDQVQWVLRASIVATDYYAHLGWTRIENGWDWKRAR